MKLSPLALVFTLALGAGSAQAAVEVIGNSVGHECFLAARDALLSNQAVALCDQALADADLSRRDRAATLVNRGVLHLRRMENDAALSDFDAAIVWQPQLAEAHVDRGAALVMLNRSDEAVKALDQGLALKPDQPQNGHFIRAVAREKSGDVKGAYEDFRRAAELAPDWARPQHELRRFAVRAK